MKKFLQFILLIIGLPAFAQNQDTLLYERFELGGNSFTLNTAVAGGAAGTAGYNQWTINNAYQGGNGQLVCLGFPFNFNIPNTPPQPAAQTGGINTNYMHIVSDAGQASGIQNCCYQAADGICGLDETNFSSMTQDVVTTGYDTVTVSFLWLCVGGTNIYGEFYYSTDAGITWTLITTPVSQYRNQNIWVQQNITIPAFAGQSMLRFGFRFVNQSSTSATEPGFGIGEFMITAKNSSSGLNDVSSQILNVFPNPTDGIFHVSNMSDFTQLEIINSVGETILLVNPEEAKSAAIDLSKYAGGIYFLNGRHHNGNNYQLKIVRR